MKIIDGVSLGLDHLRVTGVNRDDPVGFYGSAFGARSEVVPSRCDPPGNGVSVTPDDPAAILQAFIAIAPLAPVCRSLPARRLVDRSVEAAQVAGILEAVVAGHRQPALAGAEVEP